MAAGKKIIRFRVIFSPYILYKLNFDFYVNQAYFNREGYCTILKMTVSSVPLGRWDIHWFHLLLLSLPSFL